MHRTVHGLLSATMINPTLSTPLFSLTTASTARYHRPNPMRKHARFGYEIVATKSFNICDHI